MGNEMRGHSGEVLLSGCVPVSLIELGACGR